MSLSGLVEVGWVFGAVYFGLLAFWFGVQVGGLWGLIVGALVLSVCLRVGFEGLWVVTLGFGGL